MIRVGVAIVLGLRAKFALPLITPSKVHATLARTGLAVDTR